MVAKITVPNSIRRALNYNEQKMKAGKAECIYAHQFLMEASALNFHQKLERFESLIGLNKRASTNSIHISLNFGPEEKIGREKMVEIAESYMEKIGFGNQPYLVYQHQDAGHPHIHIVSTNIQEDGKRISLHNIGRNQSTTARREIEIAFGLKKTGNREKSESEEITPVNAQKLAYGRSEVKRGIINVLDAVLPCYKYASLPELNAILKLYNLVADRGREDGIIFRKRGLLYRVLDSTGNKIGVSIKASSIYNKPTLEFLEKKFRENEAQKPGLKRSLKTSIDWIIVKRPKSLEAFKLDLEKEKISLVIRQNEAGIVYGLTYIDHNTKAVFNGSDIGKEYSAKVILEKCGFRQINSVQDESKQSEILQLSPQSNPDFDKPQYPDLSKITDVIINPSDEIHYLPYELKKRKRKRRKNN